MKKLRELLAMWHWDRIALVLLIAVVAVLVAVPVLLHWGRVARAFWSS